MDPLPEFVYTTKCGKNKLAKADKCGADCDNCFWSWPEGDADKGRSAEAACRCLPDQMAPEAYTYVRACRNSKAGTCQGCDTCAVSWPEFDEARWKSSEKMCRCAPTEAPVEITSWGE